MLVSNPDRFHGNGSTISDVHSSFVEFIDLFCITFIIKTWRFDFVVVFEAEGLTPDGRLIHTPQPSVIQHPACISPHRPSHRRLLSSVKASICVTSRVNHWKDAFFPPAFSLNLCWNYRDLLKTYLILVLIFKVDYTQKYKVICDLLPQLEISTRPFPFLWSDAKPTWPLTFKFQAGFA